MPTARSHLYVPANSAKMVTSAARLKPHSVILDLEDGVADNQKQSALGGMQDAVNGVNHADVWVRINSGLLGESDISGLNQVTGLAGIWIAKAEPTAHFQRIIKFAEGRGLRLGVLIESAAGYLGRHDLLAPNSVTRVQIGEYDLRGELGMAMPGSEVDSDLNGIRLEVVMAAKAAGVSELVSGVSSNFGDLAKFESSCISMANLGFNGRACIHPAQLEIVHRVFSPTAEETVWAKRIVSEFEVRISSGRGAYVDESGQMADAATVLRAQNILSQLM